MTINAPSADDIKAAFTFQSFDRVIGEPSYTTLYKLETRATRNAVTFAIRLNPPHINCAGIVEQPAVYALRVGAPFSRPTYPGDNLIYPAGISVTQRTTILNTFNTQSKNYPI